MTPCACKVPSPGRTAEGVAFCSTCGERVRDPLEETRDKAIAATARAVSSIDRRLADAPQPNGNGHGPKRLALTREEAAQALGVGVTTFKTRIAPELAVVREGKCRLYPISELERWLSDRAERPMAEQVGEGES